MHETTRPVRERIIATEILKLERRQALERSRRPPSGLACSPKKIPR